MSTMSRIVRVYALQLLYQLDLQQRKSKSLRELDLNKVFELFWQYSLEHEPTLEVRQASEGLVRQVLKHMAQLDLRLGFVSSHWKVSRMNSIDRNILRLFAFEIMFCPDIPRAVSINEALEIAKQYSQQHAAKFINGILDQCHPAYSQNDAAYNQASHNEPVGSCIIANRSHESSVPIAGL